MLTKWVMRPMTGSTASSTMPFEMRGRCALRASIATGERLGRALNPRRFAHDLLLAMENGLAQIPVPAGRFPQVSGMKVVFDPKQPMRKRVLSLEVAGKPVEPGRMYRVAVLDFLARGGDDYTVFRMAKRVTPDADAPLLANEVTNYLKALGTVKTVTEGRIVSR